MPVGVFITTPSRTFFQYQKQPVRHRLSRKMGLEVFKTPSARRPKTNSLVGFDMQRMFTRNGPVDQELPSAGTGASARETRRSCAQEEARSPRRNSDPLREPLFESSILRGDDIDRRRRLNG
jgi:hypothetical protein